MELQQFQKVLACFNPKRTDDLKPECLKSIGKIGEFQAYWIQDKDEQYPGQWAMAPLDHKLFEFGWCPEEDLEILGY